MNYAIIVAGGTGSRMKTEVPKQFLPINGLPVLMHTLAAFHNSSVQPKLILVLAASWHTYWQQLCSTHQFDISHTLISGGEQRFNSVKNALDTIKNEDALVAVHDAVRPVVSNKLITACFKKAAEAGNAIPVIGSRDSLRKKEGNHTIAINREEVLIVQTPQVFRSDLLKAAYSQPFSLSFTDDASVVEKAGNTIYTVEGEFTNIKITYPEDLEIAALFSKEITNFFK